MPFKAFLFAALSIASASAIEISHGVWENPSRAGNAIWLINRHKWPLAVDSLWIRNIGFQTWHEAALKAGGKAHTFAAVTAKGAWIPLKPKDKRKIRVPARDSLMISGFEIGERLRAGKATRAPEEVYSLELRIMDNAGDMVTVKIAEAKPSYIMATSPEGD